MPSPVDIRLDHLRIVLNVLRKYLPPNVNAWMFGSRASWTAMNSSDLDLALEGDSKLDHKTMRALENAFEDSNLPYTVDVIDLNRISDSFRRIVESQRVPFPVARDSGGAKADWRRVALKKVIDLKISSVDKKTKSNERAVRLCNYTDVYNNRFIYADMNFMMATATEQEISKWSLLVEDVIITKDSEKYDDIGVPALVREDIPNLVCGYHLAILRPSPSEIDGTYLFYALNTNEVQQQFQSYANGVTRFGLRKADIGLVEIPIPPLPQQRAIAHILGTLDDKIELNRRMNVTLEEMAQALFKSWFVDFDPVRAKMGGRWRPGESLPGLPASLYDLFPDRLVDSELGEIPEGWEIKVLGDIAEVSSGKRPNTRYLVESDEAHTPLWGGSGPIAFVSEPLIDYPILLTGRVGTLGSVFRITSPCWPSDNTLVIKPNCRQSFEYLLLWLKKIDFDSLNRGSTQPLLTQSDLKSQVILSPSKEALSLFHSHVANLYGKQDKNEQGSHNLFTQLDVLLPKLISGEIRTSQLAYERSMLK